MLDLSVIICAHDPRPHYFRRVLEALGAQTLPKQRWELLVVDNLSSSPLKSAWDLSWHPNGRHISESELGLAAARRCGIRESTAPILVFVDDDNVPDDDYLATALKIGHEWSILGTWGSGATFPEFEVRPAEDLKFFLPYLALREVDAAQWGNTPTPDVIPNGAGICVRREVAEMYCQISKLARIRITGRKGKALAGYEDIEISQVARRNKFGTGIFPGLRMLHLIPKERVTEDYLLRLYQGSMTSYFLLRHNWDGLIPPSPFRPRALLSLVKNCITRHGVDRRRYLSDRRAGLDARRVITSYRKG
jgi:glycosyltransferase involved in cell wall biosynthesis